MTFWGCFKVESKDGGFRCLGRKILHVLLVMEMERESRNEVNEQVLHKPVQQHLQQDQFFTSSQKYV